MSAPTPGAQQTGARDSEPVLVRLRDGDALDVPPPGAAQRRFHASMPGYAPTPLRETPSIAQSLRIASVVVKDESSRLGLASFKVLGASWAIYRALLERLGPTSMTCRTSMRSGSASPSCARSR